VVAGVLSGTSADGIDVVLARPEYGSGSHGSSILTGVEPLAFATEAFEPGLAQRVREILDGAATSLGDLAALDRDLGLAFGSAARDVADRHDVGDLALVASHGQTVFHHDGDPQRGRVTLQIGDGDFVSEACGTAVVSDFRTRDCAAGGQGAPLVGLVDDVLFAAAPRPLAILNVGGMSNWTVLLGAEPRAFDAGPAGSLLDGLSRRLLRAPCDLGGAAALSGTASPAQVAEWLQHPFFEVEGPRSTGRDTFGEIYVDELLASMGPAAISADVLATACAFVAEAAARALVGSFSSAPLPGSLHVAVAGGGLHNAALMGELDRALRTQLGERGVELASMGSSAAFGVPPDGREALAFAALGARFIVGEPSSSTVATGALGGRVLGKWTPGPIE
jgi:anhydro-N-acetylmuramic acid kinase